MDKEIITTKQGIYAVAMFVIGSSIIFGLSSEVKQDVWIAISLAFLMSLPMLLIYSKLLTIFPGKNLFDILHEVFGNVIGKIISLMFVWYSLHLGALVIRNFSEFVQVVSLPETPQFIIVIFWGLLSIWVVKSGIETLTRLAAFTFVLVILSTIGTLILSITKINLINIKPVLYNGVQPVLSNAFSVFSFPFAEIVVFTMALNKLKRNNKAFKVLFFGNLIGGTIILLASVRNVLVLGANTASDLYFPSYTAIRALNIGNFLQRFEIAISINYIFAGFVKASFCLYAAAKGFARILNIESSNQIAAPIGFLMMNLSCLIYSNFLEMFDWIKVYPYYAIPFQIILPIIILIGAKIKVRSQRKAAETS